MKKILLILMAVAMVAMSSSASTKIYVCGTKITGSTSFSAGGGTVTFDASSYTLTISNVYYLVSGDNNNGISVDNLDKTLKITFEGSNTFGTGNTDAALFKSSGKTIWLTINGNTTFYSADSGHAGLKIQDCYIEVKGPGKLTIKNTSSSNSANAVKGGSGNEELYMHIKECEIESRGSRINKLKELIITPSDYNYTGDYSAMTTKVTLKAGVNSNAPVKDINKISTDLHMFQPIDYFDYDVKDYLGTAGLSQTDVVISDYTPAVVITPYRFTDTNLYNYLKGLVPKKYLTASEMETYTSMNISGKNISNLNGLDQFKKLKVLNFSNNNVVEANYSDYNRQYVIPSTVETLYCYNNKLTYLYVGSCHNLYYLDCSNNQLDRNFLGFLTSDVLEYLNCSNNKLNGNCSFIWKKKLKKLDFSNNPYATNLYCNGLQLTDLNVSGCTSLTEIDCSSNQLTSLNNIPTSVQTLNCSSNKFSGTFSLTGRSALTSFDISNNPSLTTVNVYSNSALTSLNVQNCSAMTTLQCYSNKLSSLYLTGCSALVYLSCQSNQITSLSNLPTSLQTIYCNDNKLSGTFDVINRSALKTLDIKNNPNLTTLNCYSNGLTSLNVQNCSAMTTLQCYSNQLTSLNFTGCSALTTLDCHSNQLTTLSNIPSSVQTLNCSSNKFSGTFQLVGRSALKSFDISSNPNITTLDCYSNALTSLSVTNCSAMTKIYCYNNQLTSLNFSGCSALYYLDCENNKLTSLSISNNTALKEVYAGHNQISTAPAFSSGNQSTLEILVLNDNKLTSFTAQNFTKLWGLYLADNPNLTLVKVTNNSALKTLQVFNCPALTTLTCYSNALTSGNTSSGFCFTGSNAITNFNCYNNQLTSLDVSSLSNLTELKCYNNKITSLNVSNKTKLTELRCNYNQITSLNVQGCSALTYMDCGANQLYSLSVQGCNSLTELNCCLNQITESGANTLVNSLRTIPAGSQGTLNFVAPGYSNSGVAEANVITAAQVITARNKRWIPMKFVNSQWVEIPVSIVGDVDGDGFVTSADVTALYNYMLNNDSSAIVNGDQDGDGNITSADVTVVYNILLGQ